MTLQQLKQQLAATSNFQERRRLQKLIKEMEQKKKTSNDSQPKLF